MSKKYLVPPNGNFEYDQLPKAPEGEIDDKKSLKKQLKKEVEAIS